MTGGEMVTLHAGLTVPVAAIAVAIDLESRGITLRVDEDGALIARPKSSITPEDLRTIRVHRADLIRIAQYAPPEVV